MNKYRNTNAANTTKTYNKNKIEDPTNNITYDSSNTNRGFDESDAKVILGDIEELSAAVAQGNTTDVFTGLDRYMQAVRDAPLDERFNKTSDYEYV